MVRLSIILVVVSSVAFAASLRAAEAPSPDFKHDVLPLLKNRCVRCHGPAEKKAELDLALPPGIVRGGENGKVVVPGKPEESSLWLRVAADEMPEDEPLPKEEKEVLRRWIAEGARGLPENVSPKPDGDEHWAFQKLVSPKAPEVREASRVRTPVDRFILKALEANKLAFSTEADRPTLIRRVAFDLTGLPPTLEEIAQFVNDKSENAYEQMVDRYLSSPRYGERYGKYWLDAAGYADSNGYFAADTDRPLAYRYRDYVIRSINADKPWDQFIREQLAGDQLAGYKLGGDVTPDMIELLEATHYLRNSPDGTDGSDGNTDELRADKYAVLEGTMQIMGASLLGMTVQCAKCHDHKFEPFSQRDFYSLQAVIYPAFNLEKWVIPKEREVITASAAEIAAWKRKVKGVDNQIAARRGKYREWLSNNRERGRVIFQDQFDGKGRTLAELWSNVVPGDEAPAGQPAVNIDSPMAPGAQIDGDKLRIVESRDDGDRAFSTKQVFDWTPEKIDSWVQVTFDLLPSKDEAPYVGFFIALQDFNDAGRGSGGNVLIDGAASGQAAIHLDYPGSDSQMRGKIGASGYVPGRNYGVRITSRALGNFEVAQVVDGVIEDNTIMLRGEDLPDGGFGFEYCCGRSFAVDNVLIESSEVPANDAELKKIADLHRKERKQLESDIAKLEKRKPEKPGRVAAVVDLSPEPPKVFLLDRGDYKSPKEKVPPAGPSVVSTLPSSVKGEGAKKEGMVAVQSENSRLAFAKWLTEPDSRAGALLARVTVNRIWQHHFGTGIVATVDNLGYSGAPPTHPELLEFLAAEFVRSGWSAKSMHRMILNSAAYRQSSQLDALGATGKRSLPVPQADADGHLLSRFPLRRLDAEAIRDAMLAASGELELQTGGPFVATKRDDEGDVIVDEKTPGAHRRSVYLQQRRTQVTGVLEVFDAPSIVFNCTQRAPTTVPLQSLKLLNSDFVRDRAAALAKRIASEAGSGDAERIERAFLLTIGRQPTAAELASAKKFVAEQPAKYQESGVKGQESVKSNATELAWTDFCHMLLSSNTFLYVN
jgi:hypothetical protein